MNSTDIIYILLALLAFYIAVDFIFVRPKAIKEEAKNIMKELRKNRPIKDIWNPDSIAIVMLIDNDSFEKAIFTIASIRKIGCNLPIWVDTDNLHDRNIDILKKYRVTVSKKGYSRDEAIIASPYRQILYITPGVVFLQNPINLFNNGVYRQTGTIFWRSASQGWGSATTINIIRKLIPYDIPDNPILMKQATKCCDPRVLVIDKSWHLKGLGKLSVLKSCEQLPEAESIWVSFELAKESYYFIEDSININSTDIFRIDGKNVWMQIDSAEQLDMNDIKETPLDYFKRSFEQGKDFSIKPRNGLDENTKNILNLYRKLHHDLETIL